MSSSSVATEIQGESQDRSVRAQVEEMIDESISALPALETLTPSQQRAIIRRYTAVLEGNFIYWMTAAYLAAKTEEARALIIDNLHEEVRDSHPVMLRKFAIAAHSIPTDADFLAVHNELTQVRLFLGRLSSEKIIVTMAFFEGFIQKLMGYLAELAAAQGSKEFEYTDVHGVCDIAHTEGLFHALSAEMGEQSLSSGAELFEGAVLLRELISRVITGA